MEHHGTLSKGRVHVFLTALNPKVEMTPQGMLVEPAASPKEKKLLEAKYKIFLETIDIQRRWRREMDEASQVSDIPPIQ